MKRLIKISFIIQFKAFVSYHSVYVVLNAKIKPNFSRQKSIFVCYQLKNQLYCMKARLRNLQELKFQLCKLKRWRVMHLSFASPWVDPRDTHGNPEGRVHFWYFFFPLREGSCLVLETTSLDHGNIPTGFVRGSGTGKVKSALSGSMVDE